MSELAAALGAALLTGLLGSAHCLGMCAGISGLFAANIEARSLRRQWPLAAAYNGGRILSYAVLGLLAGLLGGGAIAAMPGLAGPVRLLGGIVIMLIGLQIAFGWRLLAPLESAGATLWAGIAPLSRRLLPVTNLPRAIGLGLVWGWLPCGLVYSVLLVAAASSRPADGALVMLAFGLGTMPAMLMTGLGAAQLARLMARRGARLGLGLTIVLLGLLTILLPLSRLVLPDSHQHAM